MKVLITMLVLLPAFLSALHAQVTIEECYRKARENYPLIRQQGLIEQTREYNLENARKGYLPQATLTARGSWQSDVTKLPIDPAALNLSGVKIPQLSKTQYGIALDVSQNLWDGGDIKAQQDAIRSAAEVEQKNLDNSLYTVNGRVNQLFFGVLLADARLQRNRLLQEDLQRTHGEAEACLRNGTANQADVDAISVELLQAKQDEAELSATREAYTDMLARLTGLPLDTATTFVKPVPRLSGGHDIRRPELQLYEAQMGRYGTELRQISAGLRPKFSLYANGGYGLPGLDMLESDPAPYFSVGLKAVWNLSNFYTARNRRRTVTNNVESVKAQRATFLLNTAMEVTQAERAIGKYRRQMAYDEEIVRLKTSVRRASEAKLRNGTLSGTDLMRDINAEQQAIEAKIIHEMQYLSAIYDLKHVTNN